MATNHIDVGIILFYHPHNFSSQKIQLILYEKNLNFATYSVDIANGEQFTTWFLQLNPRGEVPVLKDNDLVIRDSASIIEYLETKYNGGDYNTLRHIDPAENNKMQLYIDRLSTLPVGVLSLGSFIHKDLKLTPKSPFIGPARQLCLRNNENIYELLKKSLDEQTKSDELTMNARQNLLNKLRLFEKRRQLAYCREEYQRILDVVGNILQYFDQELAYHPTQKWLAGDQFTLIDVHFGILLMRLYQLGFENYYWSYGKLINVENYFSRFRKRSSFQRLIPSGLMVLKDLWQKTPSTYKLGTGVLAVAVLAALIHK